MLLKGALHVTHSGEEMEDVGIQLFSFVLSSIECICREETLNKALVWESWLFFYTKKMRVINHSACSCHVNALKTSLQGVIY